jgi:DNA-binding MarR family transcriptional regulator
MADSEYVYTLLKEIFLILDDGDRQLFGNYDGDRQLFGNYDLTSSRFDALVHVGERPGLSLSELSNLMRCDKSNATRIVKGLEKDGLVHRRPHETDGRSIRLYLSETGKGLRNQIILAHRRYNQSRFGQLAEDEQAHLLESLSQLKEKLLKRLDEGLPSNLLND